MNGDRKCAIEPVGGRDQVVEGQPEQPLVLAIDMGTSSVRTVLVDGRGRVLGRTLARALVRAHVSASGAYEMDASSLASSLWECIDSTLERGRALATRRGTRRTRPVIRAVAPATFVTNIVGLGADGHPVTPLYTWADTRGQEDVERLRATLPWHELYERTGCPAHTTYLTARFAWLRRTDPGLLARAVRWMSIGEYVEHALFGTQRCSYSVASWSGLLDRRRLAWDRTLLEHLGLEAGQFSQLVDCDEPIAGLRSPFRERWPELAEVPWYPAVGDGAAANIGSGAADATRAAVTLGTSGAMRIVERGDPPVTPGLWVYKVDRARSVVGGALSVGGNLLVWLERLLRLRLRDPEIALAIADMEPCSHGLVALPFVAGERSPGWRSEARAAVAGMSLATRPEHIMRAMLEAIAYCFAGIHARLPTPGQGGPGGSGGPSGVGGPGGRTIIGSGGASHFAGWLQILADVLNEPVVESREAEPSARGAALLALRSLGALRSDEQDPPAAMGVTFEPDPRRHARYVEAMERHRRLYEGLYGGPVEGGA